MIALSDAEVGRVLGWASGSDMEGFLRADDWPLVERLAMAAGRDPKEVAPLCWADEVLGGRRDPSVVDRRD